MGLLFKLGSLLYLAATAILCLDVIILHRYSTYTCTCMCPMFHSVYRMYMKNVHSTLAKQEFSERIERNPLPTNITYTRVGN